MSEFRYREDARFVQGKLFLSERKFEDAINLFTSLLQTCNEEHGETSIESGYALYYYGNSLLEKEEEAPSDDLLGPSTDSAKNGETIPQPKGDGEEAKGKEENDGDDEEEGEEEDEGNGDENNEEVHEEEATDLEVAWEVLDMSRIIFEEANDAKNDSILSEVYTRLGDILRINGKYSESIAEYLKALSIRQKISTVDRILSNLHFLLAVCYIYKSSEKDILDPLAEKKHAFNHYSESRSVLQRLIESKSESESSQTDIKELIEELTETIDALGVEIKELEGPKTATNKQLPITTVGFGQNSSSNSLPSSNSQPISSTKNATAPVDITTVQVKKKQKTNHGEPDISK